MNVPTENVLFYRLSAHNLQQKLPADQIEKAAGACGLQNTPPGSWETALFNRLEKCSLEKLRTALYQDKSLLQAWSIRGVPLVFPTKETDIFLSPLKAQEGEEPWIYTRGITLALDYLDMDFGTLLPLVKQACSYLDTHRIASKEALDQTLASIVSSFLSKEKQLLWNAPSMYGNPKKQTIGGAVVSFLLRPCSFYSLIVFGRRQGTVPEFTSLRNWLDEEPEHIEEGEKALVRKFLHCYGPSTCQAFREWLGSSPQQAKRLWDQISQEIYPVQVMEKKCWILAEDKEKLLCPPQPGESLLLLGPHDPYLDIRDKKLLLENQSLQRKVWTTVSNPGVILKDGHIAGIWKPKTLKKSLQLSMELYETFSSREKEKLAQLAEAYASFRELSLKLSVESNFR